jgi:lyso-ornithine lipid O-acyltransferase
MSWEGWLNSQMEFPRVGAAGWLRVVFRGVPLAVVVYGGLALLLLVRLVERPICGMDRPVSPWITQGVCRTAVWLLGLRLVVRGQPMRGRGAVVANHASWLDIFVLNAVDRVYFVSKAEVAGWAGIGWLARGKDRQKMRRKIHFAPPAEEPQVHAWGRAIDDRHRLKLDDMLHSMREKGSEER